MNHKKNLKRYATVYSTITLLKPDNSVHCVDGRGRLGIGNCFHYIPEKYM